jgi:hypothetical protein
MTIASQDDRNTDDTVSRSSRRTRFGWILLIVVCTLLRMALVADDEITPVLYDSTNYAKMASHYFNVDDALSLVGLNDRSPIDSLQADPFKTFPTHRPGLGLLAWGTTQIGIPYKLFLDALILLGAVLAGLSIARITKTPIVGMTAFVLLMFNPWAIEHAQLFMTEPMIAVMILIVVASTFSMVSRPIHDWKWSDAMITSFAGTIYILSRNETALLAGYLVLLWLIVLFRHRKTIGWRLFSVNFYRDKRNWKLGFLMLPLVFAWVGTKAVGKYNKRLFGVSTVCVTEAEGMKELVSALRSIEPDEKIRFAPITRKTIEKACDVCPTLNQRRRALLDVNAPTYQSAKSALKLDGEVGTWISWHLSWCYQGVNRSSNHEMRIAAKEVREALDNGKLPKRFAPFPYNPMWKEWLPEIPEFVWRSLKRTFYTQDHNVAAQFDNLHVSNAVEQGFFDEGVLCRASSGYGHTIRVFAKPVDAKASKIFKARIESPAGDLVADIPIDSPNRTFTGSYDDVEDKSVQGPLNLRMFAKIKGKEVQSTTVNIEDLDQWGHKTFTFGGGIDSEYSESWYITSTRSFQEPGRRATIKNYLEKWYWYFLLGGIGFCMIMGFFAANKRGVIANVAWAAFGILGFLVARCLFYSLIHAWLYWGLDRYVDPNVLVGVAFMLCAGFVLGGVAGRLCGIKPLELVEET